MPSNNFDFEKISTLSRGANPVPVTSPHMCGLWWLLSVLQYKNNLTLLFIILRILLF